MKHNHRLPTLWIATLIALFWLLPAAVSAEDGVMSISIDRTAISGLIRAGLPKTREIRVPGLGMIQLHLTPPDQVSFEGGKIEVKIGYRLSPSGLSGVLVTRYAVVPGKELVVDKLSDMRQKLAAVSLEYVCSSFFIRFKGLYCV